jgi:hypothetical protein
MPARDANKTPDSKMEVSCPYCGMRAYPTKRIAKIKASTLPGRRLHPYRCDLAPDGVTWWHLSAQPAATRAQYRENPPTRRRSE